MLVRLETARRESRFIEFKREFDTASNAAWCEVIKDIIAMANSGGGAILFGVENDGSTCVADAALILALDIADLTNRIQRYTNFQMADIEVVEIVRHGKTCAAFIIGASDIPIVFAKPGTYDIGGGKQRSAFGVGTVYFRHGAKSEPGNRDDLAQWRDREIARVRDTWLGGIRKVVEAPEGHVVTVVPAEGMAVTSSAMPLKAQISADAGSIRIVPQNAEEIWPYRQKQLLSKINSQLSGKLSLNGRDILCINKVYNILKDHPEFAYRPHSMASPQYSEAMATWIVERCIENPQFLAQTREKFRALGAEPIGAS